MRFEKWDPDIVKEEEGSDGDNHDQANLSAQEMSKFVYQLCYLEKYTSCFSIHFIWMPGSSQHHQACKRTLDLKKVFIPDNSTTGFLGSFKISNLFPCILRNIFIDILFLHYKQGSVSPHLPKISVQIL